MDEVKMEKPEVTDAGTEAGFIETDAEGLAEREAALPPGFGIWRIEAVLMSREEAERVLDAAGANNAVRFIREAEASEEEKRLAAAVEETKQRLAKYVEEHSVKTFLAKSIGCKKCGSQLAKEYLKDDICPLCGNDLRAASTIEGEQKIKAKIAELEAALDKERRINHLLNGKESWLLYL